MFQIDKRIVCFACVGSFYNNSGYYNFLVCNKHPIILANTFSHSWSFIGVPQNFLTTHNKTSSIMCNTLTSGNILVALGVESTYLLFDLRIKATGCFKRCCVTFNTKSLCKEINAHQSVMFIKQTNHKDHNMMFWIFKIVPFYCQVCVFLIEILIHINNIGSCFTNINNSTINISIQKRYTLRLI